MTWFNALISAALCAGAVVFPTGNARAGSAPAPTAAFTADVKFRFAPIAEAREFLKASDEFTQSLSPSDLLLRFDDGSADYGSMAAAETLSWDPEEIAKLTHAIQLLHTRFVQRHVSLPLPGDILLIQTSGAEEAGAGNYTRRNAIILPEVQMRRSPEGLVGVLAHELFHIATRNLPSIRNGLYRIIGFFPCGPLVYPDELRNRKITNPDAFHFEYCINVEHGGSPVTVVPITYLETGDADGKSLFDRLALRLLGVSENGRALTNEDGAPVLHKPAEVSGYFEQIGRNTDYIVHPEEVLADNFSILIRGQSDIPNPEIPDRIRTLLSLNPRPDEKAR